MSIEPTFATTAFGSVPACGLSDKELVWHLAEQVRFRMGAQRSRLPPPRFVALVREAETRDLFACRLIEQAGAEIMRFVEWHQVAARRGSRPTDDVLISRAKMAVTKFVRQQVEAKTALDELLADEAWNEQIDERLANSRRFEAAVDKLVASRTRVQKPKAVEFTPPARGVRKIELE